MTKTRKFIIILLVLLMVQLTSISSLLNSNSFRRDANDISLPKSSSFWVMGPIHIEDLDGIGPQYTWAEAVVEPWCSGNGSALNPYTIENVTINAGGAESAIYVENSNGKYFTIRNCTLLYAGTNLQGNAGVKLENTSNGTIEENIFLHNIKFGVYLFDSNYNVVRNNYMYNTSHGAIRLDNSSHNNLTNNEIEEGGDSLFSCGFYISSSSRFNQISFNNVSNVRNGIEIFSGCYNNTISNSYITSIQFDGIIVNSGANNNTFTENTIENTDDGIIVQGDGNMIYSNYMSNNVQNGRDDGQYNSWDNGALGNYWDDYLGEDLDDNGIGDDAYDVPGTAGSKDYFPIWDDGPEPIYIDGEATGVGAHNWTWAENQPWCTGFGTLISPYTIEGISRDGKGNGFCISVQNSHVYFEVRDCNFYNAGFTWPDTAILLNNVGNATIIGNDLRDTNFVGIRMDNCENNYIIGNNASFADLGIVMTNSEFNYVISNTINDNLENAINIDDYSNNNTISRNTVITANSYGISIFGDSDSNIVSGNYVEGNNVGISMLDHCDFNRIYENELVDNNIGVSIYNFNSTNNVIYNNTFVLNNKNGQDDSFNINYWSYSMLGNYWDDYGGDDANDDGIGDTPYVVSGIRGRLDNYPIWDDGDDIFPTIVRNSPSPPFQFGATAPTFNLTIYDANLHMAWYKLNDTYTHFFTPVNGINIIQIDQDSWVSLAEGSFSIGFFVNDTSGNLLTIGLSASKELLPEQPTQDIPFGHYYLIYLGIGILSLIVIQIRRRK